MTSLAVESLKNNINNYKGVMLCTRPNENIGVAKERPFVSRVDPKDQLGVNPVKRVHNHVHKRKANPALSRHRQWLEDFKMKMREKRSEEEYRNRQDKEKFERIREYASVNRGKSQEAIEETQNVYEIESPVKPKTSQAVRRNEVTIAENAQQEQISPARKQEDKPTKPALKKKEKDLKPKWAYTEKQVEDEEEGDLDDLLAFTNNLDYDKYINDLEVKGMVAALKKRIDELNNQNDEEDDWKKKIVDAWNKEERKSVQPSKVNLDWETRSDNRSMASDSKSVASERTQKSIQDLKTKLENKERKEWDTLTTSTKKNVTSIEERLAKHVADEILRNNTEFRHFHSNNSVRKILEKEAQKMMEENKGLKGPEIVSNKEYFSRKDVRDPNNLPYLHRNPAI
jgi:hypothetical protein